MSKIESLYYYIILIIEKVFSDSAYLESYSQSLDEPKSGEFIEILNTLENEKDEIFDVIQCYEKARMKLNEEDVSIGPEIDLYQNYGALEDAFTRLINEFECVNLISLDEIKLFTAVSKAVTKRISTVPAEDAEFSIVNRPLDLDFSPAAFVSYSPKRENVFAWVSFSDFQSVEDKFFDSVDLEFCYSFLASFHRLEIDSKSAQVFFFEENKDLSTSEIESFLKLHILSEGLDVSPNIDSERTIKNSFINGFHVSRSYSQFYDTINILAEYVSRKDALSKFLSLYHILENLMCRVPIAELERSADGSLFNIRRFKALYGRLDKSENQALSALLHDTFELPYRNGKFKDRVMEIWDNFKKERFFSESEVDSFLHLLADSSLSKFNSQHPHKFICNLIYQIRCSIVHNKETEYHISSNNYSKGCRLVIERFLFELLEDVIFFLMSKENKLVWYTNNKLSLW